MSDKQISKEKAAAKEAVEATASAVAALRAELGQINKRLKELEAEKKALLDRSAAISYRSWGGDRGLLHDAEEKLAKAKAILSDVGAPTIPASGQFFTSYVVVSAGPKRLNLRAKGQPTYASTVVERSKAATHYPELGMSEALYDSLVAAFKEFKKAQKSDE